MILGYIKDDRQCACNVTSWFVPVNHCWRLKRSVRYWRIDAFFVIKPTGCTNFTNLFRHENLHISDSSSVHHQEFIHYTLSNGICHTGL